MYKNIVPSLISFDTKLKCLHGLNYSEEFNFYPQTKKPNRFHYQISIDDNIKIPDTYDFRNGNIFKLGRFWYYKRKLPLVSFSFCYDDINHTFTFDRYYQKLPFEIGHIFPVGRHIRDIIELDLFLHGYITILGGFTLNYKNKNITVIGPSMNGKTTFLKKMVEKGGKYISEGPIIINFKKKYIYPCSNLERHGRKEGRMLYQVLSRKTNYHTQKVRSNKIYFTVNSTSPFFKTTKKEAFDFVFFRSLFFLKNPFTLSYIFKNNLVKKVFSQIESLKKLDHKDIEFFPIKNYNYSKIFENNV